MSSNSSGGYLYHRVDLVISSGRNYGNITTASIVLAVILAVIFVGSVAGNLLVLFAIRKDPNLHNPANYLICSLAVTDLLVAFLVMPFNAIYQVLGTWIFGDIFCQVWSATDIACCTASILHLCAIALERHQSVTNAVRYFALTRRHTVAPKILAVWILSICISIPPVLGWRTNTQQITETIVGNATKHCQVGHQPSYTVFATMGSFYVPLLMLLIVYGRIYRSIHTFVKRSESRSILSSFYSEDRTSVATTRSSLFSFRRKSQQSRGSVSSKWSFFTGKRGSSQTKRSSRRSSHQSRNFNKMETQTLANNPMTPRTDQNERILEKKIETNKEQNPSNVDELKVSKKTLTSPKDFRQKFLSHPSASSPGATARRKRSAFFRRQMAIDNDFECSPGKNSNTTEANAGHYKEKQVSPFSYTNNFDAFPYAFRKIERRFSENDLLELRRSSEGHSSPPEVRRRTNTAGAKVRFVEEKNQSYEARNYKTRRSVQKTQPKLVKKMFSSKASRTTLSIDWRNNVDDESPSVNRKSNNLNCCLLTLQRGNNASAQRSKDDKANRFARYSFSVRAKIKALRAREIRAIRTLGSIVGAFVVCWLPFFIVTIAKPFCSCHISNVVEGIVLWLGYCNSLVNPIIYAACNRDFQIAFRKLLDSQRVSLCSMRKRF